LLRPGIARALDEPVAEPPPEPAVESAAPELRTS
jgi:hypothetical protein